MNQELLAQIRGTVEGRRLLVGVGAGIAAYKVCSVVSALAQAGAEVTVAMTPGATRFVGPLTFEALSGRPVLQDIWSQASPGDPQHIALATRTELMLVAPCTMDQLANFAAGRADDIVSLLVASIDRAKTPVLLAPSMNDAMWRQPATQRNLQLLEQDGFAIVQPGVGWQACRTVGTGRLPEPEELIRAVAAGVAGERPLRGRGPAEPA